MDSEKLIHFTCTFTEAVQELAAANAVSDDWCKLAAANSFADTFEEMLGKVSGLDISDAKTESDIFSFCSALALAIRTYVSIHKDEKLADFIEQYISLAFEEFEETFDFIEWDD